MHDPSKTAFVVTRATPLHRYYHKYFSAVDRMYQSQAIQESCLAASGFPGKRSHFSAFRKQCHIGQDSPTIYRQGYIIGSDIHLLNLHSVFVRILSKDGHSRLNDICKNSRFEKKIYPTKFNSTYIKNSTADDNSNNSGSG